MIEAYLIIMKKPDTSDSATVNGRQILWPGLLTFSLTPWALCLRSTTTWPSIRLYTCWRPEVFTQRDCSREPLTFNRFQALVRFLIADIGVDISIHTCVQIVLQNRGTFMFSELYIGPILHFYVCKSLNKVFGITSFRDSLPVLL